MTDYEKSIVDKWLKGVNMRLLWGLVVLVALGTWGVSTAHNSIINEIRADKKDGVHKDEMQDEKISGLRDDVSNKLWRSEFTNYIEQLERDERVKQALRK